MNMTTIEHGATMSSREIAELTGKQHGHVKRDVEKILGEAEIALSTFGCTYLDSQNKEQTEYKLPKRECDLVISGYSVKYRLAIIDRWHELEQKQSALPKDFSQALRMLADNVESNAKLALENEQQRHVIAENKPKVVYANAVLGATNAICVRDWVKTLQTEEGLEWGERKVWRWLEDKSYIFRQNKKPRPYAGKAMNYFTLEPIIVATSKGNKEQMTFKVTGVGQIELGAKILQDSKGAIA